MNNINQFIRTVSTSRKRTGVVYCAETFSPIIKLFQENILEMQLLDCARFYKGSMTFSANELLNQVELEAKGIPTMVFNLEAFIVANSRDYGEQVARMLTIREPVKPLFFVFYSKKIFRHFKDHFEVKELNRENIIEL